MSETRRISKIAVLVLGLASLVFVVIPIRILNTRVEALETAPFIVKSDPGAVNTPIPIGYVFESGKHIFRTQLDTAYPRVPKLITIQLATGWTSPRVLRSSIKNLDGSCEWKSEPGVVLEDNALFTWKLDHCNKIQTSELSLEMETDIAFTLYVWTVNVSEHAAPGDTVVRLKGDGAHAVKGHFTFETGKPSKSVLELMSYVWDQENNRLVLGLVIVGLLCTVLGIFGFWSAKFSFSGGVVPTVLVWMGLSALYIVICPPFQAPDEPDHLLGYAATSKHVNMASELLQLANRGHLERIKFHPDQKFSAANFEAPTNVPWASHITPTDMNQRSQLTAAVWKVFDRFLYSLKVADEILSLRALHSLFVLLFFVAGSGIFSGKKEKDKLVFPVLTFIVPTLVFFSMHISNYYTAIAIYLASGFIFYRSLLNNRIASPDLTILGLCIALSPFTAKSGSGALIVWAIVLSIALFTEQGAKITIKRQLFDCALFSIPLVIGQILFNSSFLAHLQSLTIVIGPKEFFNSIMNTESGLNSPYSLLFPLLFLIRGKARYINEIWEERVINVLKICFMSGLTIFGSYYIAQYFYAPLRISLPDIEVSPTLNALHYAGKALLLFWLNLLPGPNDFFLSASFWSGYGWLEFNLPSWLVNLIRSLYGVTFLYGLGVLIWSKNFWQALRGTSIFIVINVLIFGLAFRLAQISVNLHGRYLIFCFILTIVVSAYGLLTLSKKLSKHHTVFSQHGRVLGCIGILVIHTFAISLILHRYFL